MRIRHNDYELTPENYKALSYTGDNVKTMKNKNDISMMNIFINDLGYTGTADRNSERKTFFTLTLPNLVDEIENRTFDELTDDSEDLQR